MASGKSAALTAYCARGEVALGGGGSYSAVAIPTGHQDQYHDTNLADDRDHVVASRPAVSFVFTGDHYVPVPALYSGFPEGHYSLPDYYQKLYGPVTGRSGWTFQAVNGATERRALHAFAVCVRAKRLDGVAARAPVMPPYTG